MNAQPYDFTIPAYGTVQLSVCGSNAKILSSSGPLQILTDSGARVTVSPGQGVRDFDFNSLTLVDKSGATNTGFILISDADMIDDRITGEVSVIDGGKARTKSDKAFSGTIGCLAVAGQYAQVQLWNPVGSAKDVFVESLMISCGTGTAGIAVRHSNLQLTVGYVVPSKKVGGVGSSAILCQGANVVGQSLAAIAGFSVPASTPQILNFREPMQIPPGSGLVIVNGVLGYDLQGNFEIFEEPV